MDLHLKKISDIKELMIMSEFLFHFQDERVTATDGRKPRGTEFLKEIHEHGIVMVFGHAWYFYTEQSGSKAIFRSTNDQANECWSYAL
jgi:hypothetical protein